MHEAKFKVAETGKSQTRLGRWIRIPSMGNDDEQEWLVDEIVGHKWEDNKVQFHVRWTHGDTTWEPYTKCSKLAALEEYFRLQGVKHWRSLARKPAED